ncbi:MAG: serine hydrolase domain-containing protein [Gemmatimonadota bacterium]
MRRLLPLLALSLLAACAPAVESNDQPVDDPAIARVLSTLRPGIVVKGADSVSYTLADRMAHYRVPGVSIAVVDSGRIVWARGIGLKELATADSVTPTTLFQAASISKPVTATAMLHLVDQGKLALDTPVNDYLKSWKLPDNAFTKTEPVTLRRIVSHSAGLTVHGFPGYAITDSIPTVVQVLDGAKPANTAAVRVDTTPGAIMRYSGGGTTIEQLVLTDVTGESFPALMKRLVLDPIGMSNSGYDQPLPQAKRGDAAAGYKNDGTMIEGRWHVYPEMAAAGLWTTPTDLMRWALEIAAARDGRSSILAQQTAKNMLTIQKAPVGLGPFLGGTGDGFNFGHGGANEGYRAEVIYFPELGRGAAVMTNSDAGSGLAREILLALAAEYHWTDYGPREVASITLDTLAMEAHVGVFAAPAPDSARVTVTRVGRRLFMEAPRFMPKTEVVFVEPHKVVALASGMGGTFIVNARGTVTGLEIAGMTLKRSAR